MFFKAVHKYPLLVTQDVYDQVSLSGMMGAAAVCQIVSIESAGSASGKETCGFWTLDGARSQD